MTEPTGDIPQQVLNAAKRWLGTTYAWGGGDISGPTLGLHDGGVADRYGDYLKVGFDCSGLTQYAWGQVGIDIGGDSTTQHANMNKLSAPQPACVLWWPGHVSLYIDSGSMIEAPQSGDVVKISPLRNGGVPLWPKDAENATPGTGSLPGGSSGGSGGLGSVGEIAGVSFKALLVIGLVLVIGGMIVFSQVGGD
jgi:cell wall-associated NlpC family hydrolase